MSHCLPQVGVSSATATHAQTRVCDEDPLESEETLLGFGGISIWQLLIMLVIVLLLFGTKRLKNIGSDLGGAIKGFRKSMSEGEKESDKEEPQKIEKADDTTDTTVIEGESSREKDKV